MNNTTKNLVAVALAATMPVGQEPAAESLHSCSLAVLSA
jgi:hypothetical protein